MAKRKVSSDRSTPVEVFYSYSHKDEELCDELRKHLIVLEREGVIAGWHDRKIVPGDEWGNAIDKHLNTAKVILLLVSIDFVASEYCWSIEVKRAMQRHEAGEARVIPIILRECDWSGTPFGKLQALPKDAAAITRLARTDDRDSVFAKVATGIRDALRELKEPTAQVSRSGRSNRTGRPTRSNVANIATPARRAQVRRKHRQKASIAVESTEEHQTDGFSVTIQNLRADLDRYLEPILDDYLNRLSPYRESKIIRDVIWNFNVCRPYELAIIDSPPFQRLRNIYQTSLALFTYPCCVHSRFEHSLGAAAVSSRMLAAISERKKLDPTFAIETRLAAILHDIGHGPFSHSSERFYEQLRASNGKRIFDELARQDPLVADASASEIVAYLLITTKSFQKLWNAIVEMYPTERSLKHVDLQRIATMIVGIDDRVGGAKRFYRQIVNGPFDADKLDYLPRDGYFTGLEIVVDIERLLHTVTVASRDGQNDIAVTASGSSVLEQVLFAKTQLYSSVYHHHKVRAAHQLLMQLFRLIVERDYRPGKRDLRHPASYVMLDDYDFLHTVPQEENQIDELVSRIKGRVLPKRAIVISPSFIARNDVDSRLNFDQLFDPANDDVARKIELRIISELGLKKGEVMVDVPDSPRLGDTGQTLVQLGSKGRDNVLLLQDIYPAGAWAKAYAGYRKVAYVFTTVTDDKQRKRVGAVAQKILSELEYPIKLTNKALELAKNS